MSDSRLVYTSTPEGGIEHRKVVEPAISTTVRMNDPGYGLSIAARVTHDKVERDEARKARQAWHAQRNEAIAKQRQREAEKRAARIAELDIEIARLRNALETGTASDPDKVAILLDRLTAKRENMAAK